jgi:hypothetical protein
MTTLTRGMLNEAWTALGGAPEAAERVRWTGPERDLLPSALPVSALAGAVVGAASGIFVSTASRGSVSRRSHAFGRRRTVAFVRTATIRTTAPRYSGP